MSAPVYSGRCIRLFDGIVWFCFAPNECYLMPSHARVVMVGVHSIMYHLVFCVRVLALWPAVDPTVRLKQCAGRWLGWGKRQCHCLMSSTAVLMEAGSGWITCTCLGTKSLFNCSKWWGCKSLKINLCIYLFTWWGSQYLFLATKGAQIYKVKVSTIAFPWSCRIFLCSRVWQEDVRNFICSKLGCVFDADVNSCFYSMSLV